MAEVTGDRLASKADDIEGGAPPPKPAGADELTIPVRKTSLHNMQGYAVRKTIEAKKKTGEGDEVTPPAGDEDEDELTPEATNRIREEVDRAIDPLRKAILSRSDEDELSELYADDPDAQKYDKQLRAYMGHDGYKSVPASVIYHHLAYGEAAKAGSKKRNVADVAAGMSGAGGHSRRERAPDSDIPDFDSMDEKEFEAYQNKVRQQPPARKPQPE